MSRRTFIHILFITVITLVILLGYVLIVSKIRGYTIEKQNLTDILNKNKNQVEILLVEVQKLSSQERIVNLAQSNLSLVQSNEPYEDILTIDKQKIQRILKIVNDKYE